MKIFKKENRNPKELHPLVLKMLLPVNNVLKLSANWMQQKTKGYSSRKRKIILVLFCVLFISESLFIIYQSFKKKFNNFYVVTPIRPIPLLKPEKDQSVFTKKELLKIHNLKIYLDSLQSTAQGKLKFDSFLSAEPHLLDTINYLENIYYEQQTNRK